MCVGRNRPIASEDHAGISACIREVKKILRERRHRLPAPPLNPIVIEHTCLTSHALGAVGEAQGLVQAVQRACNGHDSERGFGAVLLPS